MKLHKFNFCVGLKLLFHLFNINRNNVVQFPFATNMINLCFLITKLDLARSRKSGVSLMVDCIAQQQESGEQCSLGHTILPLTSLDPEVKVLLFSVSLIRH